MSASHFDPNYPCPENNEFDIDQFLNGFSNDPAMELNQSDEEFFSELLLKQNDLESEHHNPDKKEQRKIANKKSAQKSREKRAASIEQLKEKAAQLTQENEVLKKESTDLRMENKSLQDSYIREINFLKTNLRLFGQQNIPSNILNFDTPALKKKKT